MEQGKTGFLPHWHGIPDGSDTHLDDPFIEMNYSLIHLDYPSIQMDYAPIHLDYTLIHLDDRFIRLDLG